MKTKYIISLLLPLLTNSFFHSFQYNEEKEVTQNNCTCEYSILHKPFQNESISESLCEYTKRCCNGKYFNILSLNYCYINSISISLPIVILILLLSFYLLSTTGNDYLANALGIISEKMEISQNLAGVTFLALGNQAPDVAVAFIAGEGNTEGVLVSLSSLLGSGSIVISVVLSSVIILGKGVKIFKGNFIRDLFFYFITLVFIICFSLLGKIQLWGSILILVIYAIYVLVCVSMDKEGKKKSIKENILNQDYQVKLFGSESDRSISVDLSTSLLSSDTDFIDENNESPLFNDEENNDEKNEDNQNKSNENTLNSDEKDNNNIIINELLKDSDEKTKQKKGKRKFNINEHIDKGYYARKSLNLASKKILVNINKFSDFQYSQIRNYMKMGEEGNKRGLFGKIIYFLIDIPFDLLRDISIPPFELKKWNKNKFSILPLGLSFFLTVSFELYDLYINYPIIVIIYYIFILVICILFYVNSYRGKLPNCTWGLLSTAFIMSIIWIWTVTNILMDMIQAIQMLIPIQLPEVFLTMTVLALGNSLPDFIVNCSLAKNGYGEMALSGCIGAPVFGLTFGFGISLLKRILVLNDISEGLELNLWNTNDIQSQRIIFAAFCNILCTIFILLVFGYKLKFKLKKIVGYICYFIYTCYFVALVYFSFFNQNSKK